MVQGFYIAINSESQFRLLITYANSLDPDQAEMSDLIWIQTVAHSPWWYSWNYFLKKFILKKSADDKKSWKIFPACKALILICL